MKKNDFIWYTQFRLLQIDERQLNIEIKLWQSYDKMYRIHFENQNLFAIK